LKGFPHPPRKTSSRVSRVSQVFSTTVSHGRANIIRNAVPSASVLQQFLAFRLATRLERRNPARSMVSGVVRAAKTRRPRQTLD